MIVIARREAERLSHQRILVVDGRQALPVGRLVGKAVWPDMAGSHGQVARHRIVAIKTVADSHGIYPRCGHRADAPHRNAPPVALRREKLPVPQRIPGYAIGNGIGSQRETVDPQQGVAGPDRGGGHGLDLIFWQGCFLNQKVVGRHLGSPAVAKRRP